MDPEVCLDRELWHGTCDGHCPCLKRADKRIFCGLRRFSVARPLYVCGKAGGVKKLLEEYGEGKTLRHAQEPRKWQHH